MALQWQVRATLRTVSLLSHFHRPIYTSVTLTDHENVRNLQTEAGRRAKAMEEGPSIREFINWVLAQVLPRFEKGVQRPARVSFDVSR